jgi:hypothetical protein
MAAISKLCNKGILLNNGQIAENSGIDTIVDSYIKTCFHSEFYILKNNQPDKDTYFEKFLSRDKSHPVNTFLFQMKFTAFLSSMEEAE